MSVHLGDFDASAVLYHRFTTFRPSTGAPYTLAGTPAISVYKDNSDTESTSGVTLTADSDSRTGMNKVAIDTSSDGTFYSAGSFFNVVITTGTVDSVSVVGSVVFSFTIRKNSALKPATAGRTVVVDASGLVDANTVKVGPTGAGTAQTARDIGASVLLSAGTGTGQLDFTSGVVKANATQFAGQTITCAGGVTVPAATLASTTNITAGTITTTTNLTTNNDKTGYTLSNTGIDAILDRSAGVETGFTLRQSMRLMLAALAGKLSGAATTSIAIRDVNDTVDRISATVDSSGNRTAVTTNVT